jgi:ketosteroid isomerase-like protein
MLTRLRRASAFSSSLLATVLALGTGVVLFTSAATTIAAESASDAAARQKNLTSINTFFKTMSPDVDALFADDAVKEITFATFASKDESPLRWVGKEEIKKNFKANDERFSGWTWENVKIYSTQNPNVFWVEADGTGKLKLEGVTRTYTQKNYFVCFDMKDGKIKRYREIMNPLELIKSIGGKIELPPGFVMPKY